MLNALAKLHKTTGEMLSTPGDVSGYIFYSLLIVHLGKLSVT